MLYLTFDEFLYVMMPEKRAEDRMRIFRKFIKDWLTEEIYSAAGYGNWPFGHPNGMLGEASDDDVFKKIAQYNEQQFNEVWFNFLKGLFLPWLAEYEANKFVVRAQKGAAAKWKKKRRK